VCVFHEQADDMNQLGEGKGKRAEVEKILKP
jgi:hypothetical protein